MHLRYLLPSSNPNMPLFTKKLMEEKKAERRCGRKGERGVWVCPWSLPLPAVHLSCPRAPPASSKPLSFAISNLYSMFLLGTRVLAHPGAMKLPAGPEEAGWSPESHTVTRPRRVLASGGGRWARVHPCTRGRERCFQLPSVFQPPISTGPELSPPLSSKSHPRPGGDPPQLSPQHSQMTATCACC